MASVLLPEKLGYKLRAKAEATGYLPEELGVELISQGLDEELDPEDLVEHYERLSAKYLAEAKELLNEEDLVQASEKFWGATVLAVKMVAAKRGLMLEQHGSLWDFINTLAMVSGDKDIVRFFNAANTLRRNFYENEMARETVEINAGDVERLIAKLRRGEIND